jgi:hypothetical protein
VKTDPTYKKKKNPRKKIIILLLPLERCLKIVRIGRQPILRPFFFKAPEKQRQTIRKTLPKHCPNTVGGGPNIGIFHHKKCHRSPFIGLVNFFFGGQEGGRVEMEKGGIINHMGGIIDQLGGIIKQKGNIIEQKGGEKEGCISKA